MNPFEPVAAIVQPAIVAAKMPMPARKFAPTVHHVSQEQALDAVCELDEKDKRFNMMGSIEQYSGTHPEYGRCIIIITATSDATIIPFS